MTAVLKTDRLVLRPVVQNDLDLIYEYAKKPDIGPKAGWPPHKNKEETQKIMDKLFLGKETIWAITLRGDDSFRGIVGLEDDPKRNNRSARMLGYWLNEADWGKGYMTEAASEVIKYGFEKLDVPIITSNCFTSNTASQNVIEKIGMNLEGILRQGEKRFDGRVLDLRMYSLTREEYLSGI